MSKIKQTSVKTSQKATPYQLNLFQRSENWLLKKEPITFLVLTLTSLLFSILLFNMRVSEGGDDSSYIKAGYDYAHDFFHYYFTFNAPLYPMFLSLPIAIAGINLILLKCLSVVFNFLGFILFYKAFKGRIPYLVLLPTLLFLAINHYIHYFASQTYNEAMFLFLQATFFYLFFKLTDKLQQTADLSKTYQLWLLAGFILLLLTLAKNIAIAIIPAIPLYFIIQKQWKNAAYITSSFLIFKLLFEGFKSFIWGPITQLKAQGNILLLKDPYDASLGNEDVAGFISRFFGNADLYLSKRLFQIIGFRSEDNTEVFGFLTFLITLLFFIGFVLIIKQKNKALLLSALYSGAAIAATFIVLQTRWDQPRLIIIFIPFILMVIFFGLYRLFYKIESPQVIYLLLIALLGTSMLISSFKKIGTNLPILSKNLKGDLYYGYTPDWINFFKMSRWCADNLPDTVYIASRKAPMSFIYGNGHKFYPVYKVLVRDPKTNQSNPDSLLTLFRKEKVRYMILASLRMDPKNNSGNIINTLHNMLEPLQNKYPERVKLVHQIGETEPAYLYEIKY